jgi:hypothetical protein
MIILLPSTRSTAMATPPKPQPKPMPQRRPLGPKTTHEGWERHGARRDHPPPPVPAAVRDEARQLVIAFEPAK